MIKQIQLRGISRTPSDRMTADGGLAESLNIQIDENENAPMTAPEDVSSSYGYAVGEGFSGPVLYIHKSAGASYDNLVFLDSAANQVKYHRKGNSHGPWTIFSLEEGEEIKSVTSVGNTLIVSTDRCTHYALNKEGTYTDLGTRIPVPSVEFRCVSMPDMGGVYITLLEDFTPSAQSQTNGRISRNTHVTSYEGFVEREVYDGAFAFEAGVWQRGFANDQTASQYEESYKDVSTKLWDGVTAEMNKARKRGFFPCPVFVRYALRLYDGTYIYQSVPILLGAGFSDFFTAYGIKRQKSDSTSWESYFNIELKSCYSATAFMEPYALGDWGDIVESVDLFMSTSVTKPVLHSPISGLTLVDDETTSTFVKYLLTFDKEDPELEEDRNLEEVLSKSNFFKIASFKVNDNGTGRLERGYNLLADDRVANADIASEDYLVTQDELPDDFLSANVKSSPALYKYNNRIIMGGVTQEITSGYDRLNGTMIKASAGYSEGHVYEFRYHLKSPDGAELTVMSRSPEGAFALPEYREEFTRWSRGSIGSPATATTYANYCRPYAWLAYPDPKCYKVDVLMCSAAGTGLRSCSYKMEAHPFLNCAYCFIGLDKWIGHDGGDDVDEGVHPAWDRTEERVYSEPDVLWASVMDNPFAFGADGRVDFPARIVGMANTTKPLSEGQLGQFPLYVFTEEGTWTLPVTSEGDFAGAIPATRDVALSSGTIIPIEQAVVFVTSQGVMMIEGMQVTSLSPNMNGKHHVPTDEMLRLLDGNATYLPYRGAYTDDLPFLTYVSSAVAVFDYVGRRIVFFRPDQDYQYVYALKSSTWHKMSVAGQGYQFVSALNSYPDCYVCALNTLTGKHRVKNLSVYYDPSAEREALPGLIVTRPLDLGEPDVRKTVKDIRVRGNFNRGDVRYVLEGSFDGHNWRRLTSLRGGSYRLFRITLLAGLSPTERISWIDVDYEPRFTDRLR